jgi:hypothetical protein
LLKNNFNKLSADCVSGRRIRETLISESMFDIRVASSARFSGQAFTATHLQKGERP